MKILSITISIIVTLLSIGNSIPAQETTNDELRANFEKLETAIQIVLRYDPAEEIGIIDLIEGQKEQLLLLDEEYQQMIDDVQNLGNGQDQQKAKLAVFAANMTSLTSTLHDKILLPHQSELVETLVFSKFLKHRGGNLLEAIETYYRKQFGLSVKQKEELNAIQQEAAKKVAEAKERFKKELEEINKEARSEVKEVLNPRQNELLDKLEDR